MLEWLKRRALGGGSPPIVSAEPVREAGRVGAGFDASLHKYLENRYADSVVLTFAEIEDLLGSTLPEEARLSRAWWTSGEAGSIGSSYTDLWTSAGRTAKPNLAARVVTFDRPL